VGVCSCYRAGNRAQQAGTACDAHCMQRARAPTLALDSPPSLSLSHWNSRLRASLLSQHRIFTKRESLLPHAARRLIYGVSTFSPLLPTPSSPPHPFVFLRAQPSTPPPSDPSAFHASVVHISRFECSDAHRGSRDPYILHVCAHGDSRFVDDVHCTRSPAKWPLGCGTRTHPSSRRGWARLGYEEAVGRAWMSPSRVTRRLTWVCLSLHAAYSALIHSHSCLSFRFLLFLLSF
jgi:hypothetical protein